MASVPTLIREEGFEVGTISDRDVKRAERLVARNAGFLRLEWERVHAHR
jgi:hypothetical protein